MSKKKHHSEPVARTSTDLTVDLITRLQEIFPECVTEGKIDFDKLRATLGEEVDSRPERYSFSWAGKRNAIRLLQTPSRATLMPAEKESVKFDETGNLFIEGDNLEVLKLLYKSYFGQVKMIYIDPPYNTGNDFIYPDNFADPLDTYLKLTDQKDSDGNLLTSNPETSGRYHSTWLSMMYPRMFLARQLLSEDGVLFVSIDDREIFHLRVLLNEIFGEENYLSTFVWINEGNIDNQSKIKSNHEYILAYARNEKMVPPPPVIDPNIPKESKLYRDYIENTIVKNGPANPVTDITLPAGFPANFNEGIIKPKKHFWPKLSTTVQINDYKTQNKVVVSSGWSSREIFEEFINNGFRPVLDTKGQESTFYISETGAICTKKRRIESQSHVLTVLQGMGTVQAASKRLEEFGIYFDYPKPVELMRYLVRIGANKSSIIIDFFAGSCPVAEAILELNRNDGGNRRFIMIQLPEQIPDESGVKKSDFKTIADIGKERIRRVIDKMKKEDESQLNLKTCETPEDLGFKVFKLAESNYKPWTGVEEKEPDAYAKTMEMFTDPLVLGWKPENVIWEVAIKEGYGLSARIESVSGFKDNTVYCVTDSDKGQSFRICLDDTLKPATLKSLNLKKDDLFICRDAALDDEAAANLALQCRLKTI